MPVLVAFILSCILLSPNGQAGVVTAFDYDLAGRLERKVLPCL
ncbi:MAG: hypothetical protein SFY81_12330 [Verrucomicrobiota bacterium]|nr:hypothetical protein [Verrucomicrobiota bacterium]